MDVCVLMSCGSNPFNAGYSTHHDKEIVAPEISELLAYQGPSKLSRVIRMASGGWPVF